MCETALHIVCVTWAGKGVRPMIRDGVIAVPGDSVGAQAGDGFDQTCTYSRAKKSCFLS